MSSTKWKPLTNVPEGKPLPEEEVEFILIGAGSPFVWHLLIFSAGSPFAKRSLLFISPGLPRTGTMSTYAALEMILPGKCHHMARCWKGFFSNEIASTTTTIGLERTEPLEMFPSGQRQLMERWRRRSGEILSETSDWVLGSIIPSLSFGTTWSSSTQMPRSFTDSDLGSFIEGAFVLTR